MLCSYGGSADYNWSGSLMSNPDRGADWAAATRPGSALCDLNGRIASQAER